MKAYRLAFAAALIAASLVSASAREFHNDRLDGGMGSRVQELGPSHYESRWNAMHKYALSITDKEIAASVIFNAKGRATEVTLQGTTGSESKDYTIRRMLLKTRFELNPDEVGRPVMVVVKYRAT